MPALDQLKEEVAYLKLWQGIMIVTDISLAGWLVCAADTAGRLQFFLAVLECLPANLGCCGAASKDRGPHKADRKAIGVETLATIIAFCVVLVIVGIALHAARDK
jgi:hypothetical protein